MTEPCENCGADVKRRSWMSPIAPPQLSARGLDVLYGTRDDRQRWWDREEFIPAEEVADMLSIPNPGPAYMWHEHTPERCRAMRQRHIAVQASSS